MVNFAGKFNLESSENFDEFLKALGVSFMLRQMAKTAKPSIEISIDDAGVYTIKTLSMLKTTVITFKLNEEFEETRQDGKTVKSVVTLEDGNKLVQVQKGDKEVKIVREFTDEGMKTICTVGDVTSTRIYKRV